MSDSSPNGVREQAATVLNSYPPGGAPSTEDVVEGIVRDFQTKKATDGHWDFADPAGEIGETLASLDAYGPLTPHLRDTEVQEIQVSPAGMYVTYRYAGGRSCMVPCNADDALRGCVKLVYEGGGECSLEQPLPVVGLQVYDTEMRVAGILPPASAEPFFVIRKQMTQAVSLEQLVSWKTLTQSAATFLRAGIRSCGIRLVIAGPPGSGKTTLLAALLQHIRPEHMLFCIEEAPELPRHEPSPTRIRGRADERNPSLTTYRLALHALRMSTRMLVLGEVRGDEMSTLLAAAMQGTGVATTMHANSAKETVPTISVKIQHAQPNWQPETLDRDLSRSLQLVVYMQDFQVHTIGWVVSHSSPVQVLPLFVREGPDDPLVPEQVLPPEKNFVRMIDEILAGEGTCLQTLLNCTGGRSS